MTGFEAEEAWETEIGALLGALPDVEPPAGFIEAALDHRPLGALRTLAGLSFAVVVAAAASLVVGAGGGRIFPQVDDLSERHVAAAAGYGRDDGESGERAGTGAPTAPSKSLVSRGYERAATIDSAELRQAVYARDGEVVSVFEEVGELDWDRLPAAGRTTLAGTEVWIDEERAITVVETRDGVVTIVGLSPDEVRELIVDLPTEAPSLAGRVDELAATIARQLGFPG